MDQAVFLQPSYDLLAAKLGQNAARFHLYEVIRPPVNRIAVFRRLRQAPFYQGPIIPGKKRFSLCRIAHRIQLKTRADLRVPFIRLIPKVQQVRESDQGLLNLCGGNFSRPVPPGAIRKKLRKEFQAALDGAPERFPVHVVPEGGEVALPVLAVSPRRGEKNREKKEERY